MDLVHMLIPPGHCLYLVLLVSTGAFGRSNWIETAMSVIGLPEPNVTLPMESINGTYDVLLGGTFDAYLDGDGYSNVLGRYGNALRLNNGGYGSAIYRDQINEPCFSNTTACETGFTMMFWLKMADLNNHADIHYYISSGEVFGAEQGVAVFSDYGQLFVQVQSLNHSWDVMDVPFPLFEHMWYNVMITWTGGNEGLATLYINGKWADASFGYTYDYYYDYFFFDYEATLGRFRINGCGCGCGSEVLPVILGNSGVEVTSNHSGDCWIDELTYWYRPFSIEEAIALYRLLDGGLGEECKIDSDCPPLKNMECNSDEQCDCSRGYKYNDGLAICIVVGIQGEECTTDVYCQVYDQKMVCNDKFCTCSEGFTYNGLSHLCVDYDECVLNSTCNATAVSCTNTIGSYECTCDVIGFAWNATSNECEDVDECSVHNGGCTHTCMNRKGSFTCLCSDGLMLSLDNLTCLDEDECEVSNGNCSDVCINTYGSHICLCPSGFRLEDDGMTCNATVSTIGKDCLLTADCLLYDDNSFCSDSLICECGRGYEYNEEDKLCVQYNGHGASCTSDDDCTLIPHLYCDVTNSPTCQCTDGYHFLDGACFLVVVHGTDCDNNTDCQIHDDNMECESVNQTCACAGGYEYDRRYLACIEINECEFESTHHCSDVSENGVCINTPGSYHCTCESEGYTWNGTACEDVDECAADIDGCSYNCSNTDGSYECLCSDGFILAYDALTCQDFDECLSDSTHNCIEVTSHGICINCIGSYQCICDSSGYQWNGTACEDVDECSVANGGCEHTCINNIGSLECQCDDGFILGANHKSCEDFDECLSESTHNCSDGTGLALCINSIGSYQCICDSSGYQWNGTACEDVDECSVANGGCEHTCLNNIGSLECRCNAGSFLGPNLKSCEDVGDCDSGNGGCQHICNDTSGPILCSCHPGYVVTADVTSCIDVDECADQNGGCDHRCLNSPGSRYCTCKTGYILGNDEQSCFLDGRYYGLSVNIRFTGDFIQSWMSDFFDDRSQTLARYVENEITPLLRNALRNNAKYDFQYFYVSGYESGSVLVNADVIFQDDLTDFEVSYIAWLLSDVIDGVTVTTDDVSLTVSDNQRVQAVRNISESDYHVVEVEDSCSVVNSEELCGQDRICTHDDNNEPICVYVATEEAVTQDLGGVTEDNEGTYDGDSSSGLSSSTLLMIVMLTIIPILLVAVVAFIILNRKRAGPPRESNPRVSEPGYNTYYNAYYRNAPPGTRRQAGGPWRYPT